MSSPAAAPQTGRAAARVAARAARRRRPPSETGPLASVDPVARVLVEVPLAHLDRPFDYAVAEAQSTDAVPGTRVRVRFAGRLVDGYVLVRAATSDHPGRLARLARVVSPEPVLDPQVARLARAVADRYAGTVADVLRLAVPPRHAAVEAEPRSDHASSPQRPGAGPWAALGGGRDLLDALAAGSGPRAVWTALPGAGTAAGDWPDALARAALTTAATGRGALLVLPDARDVTRASAALVALDPSASHVVLTADLGPAERYRRWLAVRRGAVRVVVGTRAAAFAPVADLGLVACWDDGDDSLAEPRAPYPHAREVLLLRAHATGCAVLLGGHARSAEAQQLVASGWARSLEAPRAAVRAAAPGVRLPGDDAELERDAAAVAARLPSLAWRTARDALRGGPVLVQVPRAGYVPALACASCHEPARCGGCGGPLALPARDAFPACTWCGRASEAWACATCGVPRMRAGAQGSRRTAEELGRAFPGVPLLLSGGDRVVDRVDAAPAIVVATPGAEPPADGGYSAALLLDGGRMLARHGVRAGEEALRRWLAAAALVRPGSAGGRVVLVAPSAHPAVQALLRWDPAGAAERELGDRRALGFPPAARTAEVDGAEPDVADLLDLVRIPASTRVDVVTPRDGRARALLRAPRRDGLALSRALAAGQALRSARRNGAPVRVRVDPVDLG